MRGSGGRGNLESDGGVGNEESDSRCTDRQADGEIGIQRAGRDDLALERGTDVLRAFAEVDLEFLARRAVELEIEQQLKPVVHATDDVGILAAVAGADLQGQVGCEIQRVQLRDDVCKLGVHRTIERRLGLEDKLLELTDQADYVRQSTGVPAIQQ